MLEILALIYLCKVNGANAAARGKSSRNYKILTVVLWVGMEFMGVAMGMLLWPADISSSEPLMGAYVCGIVGALLGGFLSYKFAKTGPIVNEGSGTERRSTEWNSTPGSYTFNDQSQVGGALLTTPATIRIVEELGGYGAEQTYYYMNGQPVCALYPGMEAVLQTRYAKNIITIGKPDCDKDDKKHCVRFLAVDAGNVEIHSSAGEFIPELFKNYTSN